jgi:DNA-binding transcriptional MerR regulator
LSKSGPPNLQSASRPRQNGLLTSGDMARLGKSTVRTVRFYEEVGLIRPAQRTGGGHRLYPTDQLDRLRLVADLRAAGFSLEDIRELLEAKSRHNAAAAAAREVLGHLDGHIKPMRKRVALLQRLLAELEATRALLRQCTLCHHGQRFPDRCADCDVVSALEQVPAAAGVLWHVGR